MQEPMYTARGKGLSLALRESSLSTANAVGDAKCKTPDAAASYV